MVTSNTKTGEHDIKVVFDFDTILDIGRVFNELFENDEDQQRELVVIGAGNMASCLVEAFVAGGVLQLCVRHAENQLFRLFYKRASVRSHTLFSIA